MKNFWLVRRRKREFVKRVAAINAITDAVLRKKLADARKKLVCPRKAP